ncbi:Signal transduction histidine kinase [Desulfovibrio sp. DV]|uniref:response regulator n=1 Tax=Desulfovibrio sp. DV TaxID=1844708 RepID=UPI00094BB039|nr:response regulator [Desulfovibrio sp. DV]OLN27549.1 Signal transduction histidine kinase [Desulfovibrio sp. DV]
MDVSSPAQDLPPLTVLVVDDNDVNRIYMLHLLRKNGHTPIPAVDGRQALEVAASQTVDCILMDIQLPDMDGLTVTRAIREGRCAPANPPEVPILALTAFAMQGDRERCLEAGMDAHVSKPVRGADLFAVIGQVLSKARLATNSREELLDLSEFSRKGRREFAAELLALFLELAEPKGQALTEAVSRGDTAAALGLAHDLAGMSGPIRAERLAAAMRSLQEACRLGDITACRSYLAQAKLELAAVFAAVRAHPYLTQDA